MSAHVIPVVVDVGCDAEASKRWLDLLLKSGAVVYWPRDDRDAARMQAEFPGLQKDGKVYVEQT